MSTRLPIVDEKAGSCGSDAGLLSQNGSTADAGAGPKEFGGNALIVTLGCAKNLVDSEIMLGELRRKGFELVSEPERADLIVVNTCAFLESAVEEGIDRILELSTYKQSARCRRLIVAGCMVERYRGELRKSLPEVDAFLTTDELLKVGSTGAEDAQSMLDDARRPYFLYDETTPRVRSTASHTAYMKIAEGCDRPCTFCIIPKIRGSFRSRTIDSIYLEARQLLGEGVRELNLVAQDLTAYGSDLSDAVRGRIPGVRNQLPALLRRLEGLGEELDERFWVRLLYAYPIGVTEELIDLIVSSPRICSYLDLPLQHISSPVLKRMQRPLGGKGTRRLIEQIRVQAPSLALRTTFIVGFPGETEDDVRDLEAFVAEGHFAHVGVFTYSQESEAKSFTLPDQIAPEVREERRARIMEQQQRVLAARAETVVGTRCTALLEGLHEESDLLLRARTEWQAPETDGELVVNDVDEQLLEGGELDLSALAGRFVEVEITESIGYDFLAKITAFEPGK